LEAKATSTIDDEQGASIGEQSGKLLSQAVIDAALLANLVAQDRAFVRALRAAILSGSETVAGVTATVRTRSSIFGRHSK
jgi:hypothetical protein